MRNTLCAPQAKTTHQRCYKTEMKFMRRTEGFWLLCHGRN